MLAPTSVTSPYRPPGCALWEECSPLNPPADECRCIRRQVELNGLENVIVLDMALACEDGEIEMYSAGSHSSAYWGSGELRKVRAATLQSLMLTNRIETIDRLR